MLFWEMVTEPYTQKGNWKKRYLQKSQRIFLPNTSSDTIRTGTVSAYPAIKRDKVAEADRGQRVNPDRTNTKGKIFFW